MHDTLDTWITEALHSGTIPEPGTAWPETSVSHLRELAEQEASRLQQRGLVGRRVYWGRDHQVLLRDLEDFVDFDTTQRAAFSSRPIATELPFGMPGSPRHRSRSRSPTVAPSPCEARSIVSTRPPTAA